MIKLNFEDKEITIKNLICDNYFVQSLVDKFMKLDYSVSDGNCEICLANYLHGLAGIKVLEVDAEDDGEQVY